MSADIEKVNTQ